MSADEAFKPFRQLEKLVGEIAAELGLKMEKMVVTVTEPQIFQFAFSVSADAVMSADEKEQKKFDDKFAAIERSFQEDKFKSERLPDVRKDVEDWLKDLDD